MSPIDRFLKLWPLSGIYAVLSLPLGLALSLAAWLDGSMPQSRANWLFFIGLILLGSGVFAASIATVIDDGNRGRSSGTRTFALSRTSWLLRSWVQGGLGNQSPNYGRKGVLENDSVPELGLFMSLACIIALPFIVFSRAVRLARSKWPDLGDVISVQALDGSGTFWIARIGRDIYAQTYLEVLVISKKRRLSFRARDITGERERRITTYDEIRASDPRFIWRGEMRFWAPARDEHSAESLTYQA